MSSTPSPGVWRPRSVPALASRPDNAPASSASPAAPVIEAPPIGRLVTKIDQTKIVAAAKELDSKNLNISDVKDVGSYNWLNKAQPTILVPGQPAKWNFPHEDLKLEQDDTKAVYLKDKNAARYREHPIEAAALTVLRAQDEGDRYIVADVNVFGCSHCLTNLFRLARGDTREFRVLVEIVGTTVFFVRRENSPDAPIPDLFGYGHSFPEACCSWEHGVDGWDSYHRVVQYDLGGMNFLVRFSPDAYIEEASASATTSVRRSSQDVRTDLNTMMAHHALSTKSIPSKVGVPLVIETGGKNIDMKSLMDIKTRSLKKSETEDTIGDEMPRNWISQIKNCVLAYHTPLRSKAFHAPQRGQFAVENISVLDIRERMAKWVVDNQVAIRKYVALLQTIVAIVEAREDQKVELVCKSDVLEVHEQCADAGAPLSIDTKDRWEL